MNEVRYNEIIIARREWNSVRYGEGSKGELKQYIKEEFGGRTCLVLQRDENSVKNGVMRHFLARLLGTVNAVKSTDKEDKIAARGFTPDSGEMQCRNPEPWHRSYR